MKKLSILFIILSGCLWGSMGIFVRVFNKNGLDSMNIVGIRAVFTAAIMSILLLLYDKRLLKINIKDIWCFLGTGLFSIIFFNYCYFSTIAVTSLSVAAILLYTAPSFVMILSRIIFKEPITIRKIISLILAFSGCILVSGLGKNEMNITFVGFIIGLGSGVGYALYSIFGRIALEKGYNPLTITAYTFIFASLGVLPLTDLRLITSYSLINKFNFGFCSLFAIASTILPFLLYTIGLKHIEGGKASVMASIEPVVATIIGIFLFKEKLTFLSTMGIFLVLLSIIFINLKPKSYSEG